MRADEVVLLNVGDVTLELGREALRVVAPKNKHDRVTVLTEDLLPGTIKGLKRHLKVRPTSARTPLFVNRSGRRLTYNVLHTRWQALFVSCGLVMQEATEPRRRSGHAIPSNSCGTQLARTYIAQFPEEVVSRMLGHADPKSIGSMLISMRIRCVRCLHDDGSEAARFQKGK